MEIGGFLFYLFYFFVFWSFRLDLGASSCTFLAHDVFIFYELYMIGRDIMFLFMFLVSHCTTLIIDLCL